MLTQHGVQSDCSLISLTRYPLSRRQIRVRLFVSQELELRALWGTRCPKKLRELGGEEEWKKRKETEGEEWKDDYVERRQSICILNLSRNVWKCVMTEDCPSLGSNYSNHVSLGSSNHCLCCSDIWLINKRVDFAKQVVEYKVRKEEVKKAERLRDTLCVEL